MGSSLPIGTFATRLSAQPLRGDLHRNPTEFSLSLPGMAVTRVEQRTGVPYRQVDGVSWLHVRHVHVTPEGTGRKGSYCLQVGSHSQGPKERLPGQFQTEFFVEQVVATVYEFPDPDSLRQWVL